MMKNNWQEKAEQANLCVRNFIDGQYSDCLGDESITKYSPRDGRLLYTFACGNGAEVEHAVNSARNFLGRAS